MMASARDLDRERWAPSSSSSSSMPIDFVPGEGRKSTRCTVLKMEATTTETILTSRVAITASPSARAKRRGRNNTTAANRKGDDDDVHHPNERDDGERCELRTISYPCGATYVGYVSETSTSATRRRVRDQQEVDGKSGRSRDRGTADDAGKNDENDPHRHHSHSLPRPHGHGVHVDAHGNRYEGSFLRGRRHGYGKFHWGGARHGGGVGGGASDRFVGEWRRGRMVRGTMVWSTTGECYEGGFDAHGRMHGTGLKRMVNGDCYEGEWDGGCATGWGTKRFSCGDWHEGHYLKDKRHGYGVYTWQNGDRYRGEWKHGLMDGRGVKTELSRTGGSSEYRGQFRNGVRCGLGSLEDSAKGETYEGTWVDGVRDGPGYAKVRTSIFAAAGNPFDEDDDVDGRGDAYGGRHIRRPTEPTSERLFFEVWDMGSRVLREEVTSSPSPSPLSSPFPPR